jgi:hypothetical protein
LSHPGPQNKKKQNETKQQSKTKLQPRLPVACPWSVVLSWHPASSTTKTGRHDIAEILLKVALSTKIKSAILK